MTLEYGPRKQKAELPTRAFLYTIDQIATMLSLSVTELETYYIFKVSQDYGRQPKEMMVCHNIAPSGIAPDWRISEDELIRWAKAKKISFYARRIIG